MVLENELNLEVKTSRGDGQIKEIYISELGYLMVKIYYPSEKISINENLENLNNLLSNKEIQLVEKWDTKKLKFN